MKQSIVKNILILNPHFSILNNFMMHQNFVTGRCLSYLDGSYPITSTLKGKCLTINCYASSRDKYHTGKNIGCSMFSHSQPTSNLASSATKITDTNDIFRVRSDRSTEILPQRDISRLKFGSSAITNIDQSESPSKLNIFKKLYQKVMPDRLSVSKTTLLRSGATLSSCCTHEVRKWY